MTAKEFFNNLNDGRAVKWEELSDGGKWTRAIEAMEAYHEQKLNLPGIGSKRMNKLKCYCCGRSYPFALDTNVDESQWLMMSPKENGGGLLCESCILSKARDLGATVAYIKFDFPACDSGKGGEKSVEGGKKIQDAIDELSKDDIDRYGELRSY